MTTFEKTFLEIKRHQAPAFPTPSESPIVAFVPSLPCDPYRAKFGILDIHGDDPTFRWIPQYPPTGNSTNHSCVYQEEPTDHLSHLKTQQDLPPHLRDKLIFTYSDSQDRNTMEFVCHLAEGDIYALGLDGKVIVPQELAKKGDARVCVIRRGDHVLVWYSVFQYGATNDWVQQGAQYTTDNLPLEVRARVPFIRTALERIAGLFFPELCVLHGMRCTQTPGLFHANGDTTADLVVPVASEAVRRAHAELPDPPEGWFPPPDVIVTQSALWDIFGQPEDVESLKAFAPVWRDSMRENLMRPLREGFGGGVRNWAVEAPFEGDEGVLFETLESVPNQRIQTRWFLRTTPVPHFSNPAKVQKIHAINGYYRSNELWKGGVESAAGLVHDRVEASWGLIDWDEILRGNAFWTDDGFHLDQSGCLAYAQAILTRLEMLETVGDD
ncbi:hypothetical protein HDU98_011810 [Podochytrium sp. JEL0797]|nr:hypothetical protein HDU98_011810 [Podochytrium sp. JEL0797]